MAKYRVTLEFEVPNHVVVWAVEELRGTIEEPVSPDWFGLAGHLTYEQNDEIVPGTKITYTSRKIELISDESELMRDELWTEEWRLGGSKNPGDRRT